MIILPSIEYNGHTVGEGSIVQVCWETRNGGKSFSDVRINNIFKNAEGNIVANVNWFKKEGRNNILDRSRTYDIPINSINAVYAR